MTTPKKLRRGLADLSDYFAPSGSISRSEEPAGSLAPIELKSPGLLRVVPPEIPNPDAFLKPSLVTASVYSFSPSFKFPQLVELAEAAQSYFSTVHLVTVTADDHQFERSTSGASTYFDHISWSQLKALTQPRIRMNFLAPEFSNEKSLILFDSGFYGSALGDPGMQRPIFEFLDHCIFAVEPDTKQLLQAYQIMKLALSKNPDLRCSVLLTGIGSERLSEFIYERFSELISNFLGRDLGFLGWMEQTEVRINLDLLKEETNSSLVRYSKLYFDQLLHAPHLAIL